MTYPKPNPAPPAPCAPLVRQAAPSQYTCEQLGVCQARDCGNCEPRAHCLPGVDAAPAASKRATLAEQANSQMIQMHRELDVLLIAGEKAADNLQHAKTQAIKVLVAAPILWALASYGVACLVADLITWLG